MTFSRDKKAIGLGLAAVFAGYVAMVIALNIGVGLAGVHSRPVAIVMTVMGNLLTVLPGFTSAYFARSSPISHGLIAGGLYLLLIFATTVYGSGLNNTMFASTVGGMLIVWLGAIFGRYARTRA